ncbi:hypothetical protein OG21DRAFT_1497928, partial [Imleria badia]
MSLEVGAWHWPYIFRPIGIALAALVTQMYLAVRIWYLTGSKILYGVAILLAILSCVLGIITSVEGWIIRVTMSEIPRIIPIAVAWLSIQVVVDMYITPTLVIIFARLRTGFRKIDTILNRLIRGDIQTGLFAVIFSMGDLITFVVFPNTNLYAMFAISLGCIYTNNLLDTLLTRKLLKAELDSTGNMVEMFASLSWRPANPPRITSTFQTTSSELKVPTSVQESCLSDEGAEDKVLPLRQNSLLCTVAGTITKLSLRATA